MSSQPVEPAVAVEQSPLEGFLAGCREGALRYQVDVTTGSPVFYPRLCAPGTGGDVEWRDSLGLGTVHATTTVHRRDETPYNIVLIEVDEGFRLMSTVPDLPSNEVRIGMRVRARIENIDGEMRPVFEPVDE